MIHSTQVHATGSKAAEYLIGWQRARAELDNLRKRTEQEKEWQREQLKREIIEKIIPLCDNFQAMIQHVPDEISSHQWTEGVLHIARQLEEIMKQYNVSVIDETGKKFDPVIHEAVSYEKGGKAGSGDVIEVIQRGYVMGDLVVRAAKVKVAK